MAPLQGRGRNGETGENGDPPLSPIWVKPWLKRRDEKGAYNNILREIRLDDAESYRRYLRMNTETFEVSGVF